MTTTPNNLPAYTRDDITQHVKTAILMSLYVEDPQTTDQQALNEKIDKINKTTAFGSFNSNTKPQSIILAANPGKGMTYTYKEAAKLAAKDLGLEFVDAKSHLGPLTKQHFVFSFIDCHAFSTPFSPATTDGNELKTSAEKIKSAGAGVVLLDDVNYLSDNNAQNRVIGFVIENMLDKSSNMYVGATNRRSPNAPSLPLFFEGRFVQCYLEAPNPILTDYIKDMTICEKPPAFAPIAPDLIKDMTFKLQDKIANTRLSTQNSDTEHKPKF